MPWTDPHIHIEIRPKNDYLRARSNYKLSLDKFELEGTFQMNNEFIVKDRLVFIEKD
ncbi:MAG: hypothetical protein QW260_06800 [Thermoproteota archaeon]|nr:hypothetical protein [Candidatus Rehaiarchaeum fermentans]